MVTYSRGGGGGYSMTKIENNNYSNHQEISGGGSLKNFSSFRK